MVWFRCKALQGTAYLNTKHTLSWFGVAACNSCTYPYVLRSRDLKASHDFQQELLEFEEHLCTVLNALDEHETCWKNELTRMQFTSESNENTGRNTATKHWKLNTHVVMVWNWRVPHSVRKYDPHRRTYSRNRRAPHGFPTHNTTTVQLPLFNMAACCA